MNTHLLAERIFDRIQAKGWDIVSWDGWYTDCITIEKAEAVAVIVKLLESEQANINSIPSSSLA